MEERPRQSRSFWRKVVDWPGDHATLLIWAAFCAITSGMVAWLLVLWRTGASLTTTSLP